MNCTFFGHRDTPCSILPVLKSRLCYLISQKNANTFYVGNNGSFDRLVISALRDLQLLYPHIRCFTVPAYFPKSKDLNWQGLPTIFPEEVAVAPPKAAIERRNLWMLENSDYVVVYVKISFGGAAKFKMLAEKWRKEIFNIADD